MTVDTLQSVLVVDDFRTMADIVSRLLREIGYTDVDNALDGNAALESLRGKNYRLVISDLEMKPMSGPDLVKEIRRLPNRSDTRIILITAYKFALDEMKLAGANGYLLKPFSTAVLRDKIEEVLSMPATK
jgi:two-component system, chemotaxis family, chemotaxis protein CheY